MTDYSRQNPMGIKTAEKVGVAVAHRLRWDGEAICAAFLAALTDANYHTLAAELRPIIEADLNQPAQVIA